MTAKRLCAISTLFAIGVCGVLLVLLLVQRDHYVPKWLCVLYQPGSIIRDIVAEFLPPDVRYNIDPDDPAWLLPTNFVWYWIVVAEACLPFYYIRKYLPRRIKPDAR